MAITPGTRLGPYEIVAQIGKGGMGEVYRALDTNLGRAVAIKTLPHAVADDPERLARFEREAKTLAALNHPHIAQIYGFEKADGIRAIVMELIEGPTLFDRITQGRIPLDEALAIASQIVEALEAAHEQGIIHRDLKPANIKLRDDGTVKVLDFGLAKALDPTPSGNLAASASPTITSPAVMTGVGVLIGTAAYMSPEQSRGKAVDQRADIWAFGCVLYEMLAGKRAFGVGDNLSDAIAAILTSDVDWSALPADVPPHILTLLRRCLRKDPQKRLPHIGGARLEIDDVAGNQSPVTAVPPGSAEGRRSPAARVRGLALSIGVTVVVAALAALAAWMLKPSPVPAVTRFSMTLPEGDGFTNTGRQAIAMSPDGVHIVYVANRRLYARSLWDETPRAIAGTEIEPGVFHPVFSPDGRSLAFVAGSLASGELKRVELLGGTATTVAPVMNGIFGLSWAGDHLVYAEGGTRILRVPVAGGRPELLVNVDTPEGVASPSLLPDGRHLLFSLATHTEPSERWTKAQVVVQSLETGERTIIVDGGADGRYLPSGHLVYATGGVVYAVPFDVDRLAIRGTPAPVIEGVRRGGPTGAAQFAVSATGSMAYLPGTPASPLDSELYRLDPDGTVARLNVRGGQYEQPRLSPDGTRIAVGSIEPKLASVLVYELSGTSAMRRLGFEGNNRYPVWSGDGERILFQSDREGDLAVYWQRADGTGAPERLTTPEAGTAHMPHSASPDDRHFVFSAIRGDTATLWVYSVQDRRATQVVGTSSTAPLDATFSPDGRFLVYPSIESNRVGSRIFVMPFPLGGTKYEVGGGLHPTWSSDGRQIFVPVTQGRMGVITIDTQPVFRFSEGVLRDVRVMGATGVRAPRGFDVGRDGTMVGVIRAGNLEALSENRDIRVVLHWTQELNRLSY